MYKGHAFFQIFVNISNISYTLASHTSYFVRSVSKSYFFYFLTFSSVLAKCTNRPKKGL